MHLCFATASPLTTSWWLPSLACSRTSPVVQRRQARPIWRASTTPPSGSQSGDGGAGKKDENEDHDIPQSTVDWNGEWNKFQDSGMRSMAPKGREPVSKEELVASRVRGKVKAVSTKLPSRQQLFRDWRFWVAIIVALSLFSAFVQSSQTVGSSI